MKSIGCLAESVCDTTDNFGPWGAQGFFGGPGPRNNKSTAIKQANELARLAFLWFSDGFPIVFVLLSYGFPMFSFGFLVVFLWFLPGPPLGPSWALPGLPGPSGPSLSPPWAPLGLPWSPWALPGPRAP